MPRDIPHANVERLKPARKSRLLYCGDVNGLEDPDYIVEDFLPKDSVVAIFGQPGSKKGFVTVDLAMTVGALTADEVKRGIKLDWHGKEVEHGAVLYVWAEGQSGIKKRITAWRQMRQRMHVGHSVAIIDKAVNLRDPGSVTDLIADAIEAAEALGLPVRMIILDTLSRCSGQANINAPGEMAELVDGLERLKRETGAVIVLLHHEGKDETKGMMGATTLKGAIDAEFKVKSMDNLVTVESGKSKDDCPAAFTFKTRVVDVLNPVTREPMRTKKGKQVTTLTLETLDASEASARPSESVRVLKPKQENALQALCDWLIDHQATFMPEDNWRPLLLERGVVTSSDARQRAFDVRDQLDAKHLIRIEKGKIYLASKPGTTSK
jgi:hypothetical protein